MEYRLKLYRDEWAIVWRENSKTRRRLLTGCDRDAAERALADFKRSGQPEHRHTVAMIMEAYLKDKSDKPSHARMVWAWARLRDHFGALRPDQVDRPRCREYVAKRRRQGRGDNTIRKELTTLRSGLRWNSKATPAVIEMPPMPIPREVFITKEEFDRLCEAAIAPHVRLFLMLAWFTAARKEALLSLTWHQVDLKRGQINLGEGVGNKGRAKPPIGPSLRVALEAAKKAATTDYVIEWAGDRVKTIRKGFYNAADAAGLGHITPHDIRRSAARRMVEAGVPMSEVSQFLGHTSTAVTEKVYGRFSSNYLRKAAEALE